MPKRFKYVSCKTGELQTSIWGVIQVILVDLFRFGFLNLRWEHFDDSYLHVYE